MGSRRKASAGDGFYQQLEATLVPATGAFPIRQFPSVRRQRPFGVDGMAQIVGMKPLDPTSVAHAQSPAREMAQTRTRRRFVGFNGSWRLAGFARGRLRLRRAGRAVRSLVPLDEILARHRENDFAGNGYADRIAPAGWRPVIGKLRLEI